jgi:hypothetical protein
MKTRNLLALGLLLSAASTQAAVVQLTLDSHLFGRNDGQFASAINPAPSFAGDIGNIAVPTYWYDTESGELSSSGVTHLRTALGPRPMSRHFDRLITDLNIVNGSAAGSTAYECINGGFGDIVGASMCGNYLWGSNFVDESTTTYSGLSWTRTMGGDDVILGDPQTILDYKLLVSNWDGQALTLESADWTSSAGTAGLQMNFSVVPLPASAWLLLTGLGGVAALRARRRRR